MPELNEETLTAEPQTAATEAPELVAEKARVTPTIRPGEDAWEIEDANGECVPGWAIRADTIVGLGSHLEPPLTAVCGSKRIAAQVVHTEEGLSDGEVGRIAVELPLGSVPMDGEAYPQQLMSAGVDVGPTGFPRGFAQVQAKGSSFWCKLFPRMKGCRR